MFDNLSPTEQDEAWRLLNKWLRRRPWKPWRYPVLIGRARTLARTTPEERSAWGRRMQARHGGLAVQRMYREQGRDTLTRARHIRQLKQQERKRAAAEDARRERLGLPLPPRWKRLPIG